MPALRQELASILPRRFARDDAFSLVLSHGHAPPSRPTVCDGRSGAGTRGTSTVKALRPRGVTRLAGTAVRSSDGSARPRGLPACPTPLIGRASELALACERLLHLDVRLLTLIGAGG